jgi:hypothetical protein
LQVPIPERLQPRAVPVLRPACHRFVSCAASMTKHPERCQLSRLVRCLRAAQQAGQRVAATCSVIYLNVLASAAPQREQYIASGRLIWWHCAQVFTCGEPRPQGFIRRA